ncbi:MAG: hypothetical protein ACRD1T_05475, partial [Acidimicrobiia bacterium]
MRSPTDVVHAARRSEDVGFAPKRHRNESPSTGKGQCWAMRKYVNERGSIPRHAQNSPSLTDLDLPLMLWRVGHPGLGT